ncbi:alpha-1:6-mannosyl-glycoprotein 2-beta-N-acetylglucosaminyltransferase-like protein [Leptotrombidium deliense]|uniref:Alpha-1,6-mannosyl-glycoprotein 2-beta-N-acetylglucosaminyltransferase n=1 Tax=Leptotrombidium deliense TaxID=299467 RepID=A0A443S2N4_9ACAR|nr:alpha-1:6-mannosyl-glycoprotein 2-beta-N-acetylglucosaminyltransferase-like protein [Leptotrombidium deliense]
MQLSRMRKYWQLWITLYALLIVFFALNLREHKTNTVIENNQYYVKVDESNVIYTKVRNENITQSEVIAINQKQEIRNQNLFSSFKSDDTIIAIQVHNRSEYLKLTVSALQKVKGIEKTLIIFSHSVFDHEINKIVEEVKFAKVMQIFYPFSTQIFANSFPGDDPNDCPKDMSKSEAIKLKCNNAEFPDKYGHYRESRFVQIRHHWFWKINFIFEQLRITRNFNGYVVFIEEDYYLLPDSLYFVEEMRKLTNNDPNCVYSLGIWTTFINPPKSNIAVVYSSVPYNSHIITKQFWNTFKNYTEIFCNTDDYNFDITFVKICERDMKPKPYSIYPLVPRVFHIGDIGTHTHSKNGHLDAYRRTIKHEKLIEPFLFPKQLKKMTKGILKKADIDWGGFSDPRDRSLCMSMSEVLN